MAKLVETGVGDYIGIKDMDAGGLELRVHRSIDIAEDCPNLNPLTACIVSYSRARRGRIATIGFGSCRVLYVDELGQPSPADHAALSGLGRTFGLTAQKVRDLIVEYAPS